MDFTIKTYKKLIEALVKSGYVFQTFSDFIINPNTKSIILRHDVDLNPQNSLRFAKIQHEIGIHGSYFFRVGPESWNEKIVKEIASMGHEIGYHYENLTTFNGDIDAAYVDFCNNLEAFRKVSEIKTICMHGSPRSQFDSKDLWKKFDYKTLGIIGEPYFDIDFDNVFYLSDTGRRWDGFNVSVRDKIPVFQDKWNADGLTFHSTQEIILKSQNLPDRIMLTFHPQRWHSSKILWFQEFILQNLKNQVKTLIIKRLNNQ